ncbi:hypothetical protein HZS_2239 [Henneguya salminicola]|nr:hypothetical protein HZS_2239 [Henneguya salminicola]
MYEAVIHYPQFVSDKEVLVLILLKYRINYEFATDSQNWKAKLVDVESTESEDDNNSIAILEAYNLLEMIKNYMF